MADFPGKVERDDFLSILRIAHEASMRGAGLSLNDALTRARYGELRPQFEEADLVPLFRSHPALIEEWLQYSEDKRTDGGFYLLRDGTVGQVDRPGGEVRFPSMEEAVAAYVVRELDLCASLAAGD